MAKSSVASSANAARRENRIIPLYHQVEQVIRYRIATRQYDSGLRIPSEEELACELDVSLATIREALRELFRENLLVKARGRGTFVAAEGPQMLQPIKYHGGFLEDLHERVGQIKVATVEISRAVVTDNVRSILNLPPAVMEVLEIKRSRHVEGEPFSFTVNYLPTDIGATVAPGALKNSPFNAVLERDRKTPILRAEETVEAAAANREVAQQLGIRVLYPVMHVTRVLFTDRDRALEIVETFYRADKCH